MDLSVMERRLDRLKAFLVVFLTWAGLYLPALGEPALRIEEGWRVLPAGAMLKTSQWVVPQMAGQTYYRKPPLVNWLAAASFAVTGERSRQSARLPSVLLVLAFVTLLVWLPGDWPGVAARLIAALLFLTSFLVIAKGRRIQIESVYIPLTSLAVLTWLHRWANHGESGSETRGGKSSAPSPAWALWLAPSVFLVLGMLTKGPALLLFYYGTVLGVLAYSRRLRALLSVPHLTAIVLTLGVPALWAAVAWRYACAEHTTLDMFTELGTRLTSRTFAWSRWALNAGESFADLLPWVLLVPLLWRRDFIAHLPPNRLALFKGARLGLVIPFVAITLIPGNNPRYGLPSLGLMSILLGWLLSAPPQLPDGGRLWRSALLAGYVLASLAAAAGCLALRRDPWVAVLLCAVACLTILLIRERRTFQKPVALALLSAGLAIVLMLQYALFTPSLSSGDYDGRRAAGRVNSLLPDGQTLYVFRPQEKCFLFFVREPLEYLLELRQIDERVSFLLLREEVYRQLKNDPVLALRQPRTLYGFSAHRSLFRLLELLPEDGRQKVAASPLRAEQ